MKNQSVKGYFMVLLSAIGFGSYGIWSRIMGDAFSPFYQAWVKSALILCVLLPVAYISKSFKPVKKKDIKWLSIPVILGSFCLAPMYYAFNHLAIGTALLIFYALFLITSYLISSFFLGEVMTMPKIISLFLSLAGLIFIFGVSLEQFSLGALLLAVVSGVANGGEVSTTKKSTHQYSSLQIGIYIWAGTLLINLIASLVVGEKQPLPAFNSAWLAMVVFALIGLAASWLVVEGFRHIDASIGSLLGLSEIISGVVFGILFFHEKLTLSVGMGGGFILLAAMLPDLVALLSKSRLQTPTITETAA